MSLIAKIKQIILQSVVTLESLTSLERVKTSQNKWVISFLSETGIDNIISFARFKSAEIIVLCNIPHAYIRKAKSILCISHY